MNIFERSQASSVPAFAARAMLAIGMGYVQAGADAKAFLDSEQPDGVWTLSLLLVLWFGGSLTGAEAEAIARLIQTTGAARILGTLSLFREQLLPFVQAAYAAEDTSQLAAAGVYFRSAIDRIGPGTIASAVKVSAVADVRVRLASELPLPADVRLMYRAAQANSPIKTAALPTQKDAQQGATGRAVPSTAGTPIRDDSAPRKGIPIPGVKGVVIRDNPSGAKADAPSAPASKPAPAAGAGAPTPVSEPKPASRGDRFDRADLTIAPRKPPALAPQERLMAHLYVQGWSPDDIELLAKGPKKG